MAPQVSEDDDMEFESLGKGGEWAEGISKGVFAYKKNSKRKPAQSPKRKPSKLRRKDSLTKDTYLQQCFESKYTKWASERVDVYDSIVRETENRVYKIQKNIFEDVFDNIASFVQDSQKVLAVDAIPTAVLLTGVNMPDHTQVFAQLVERLKNLTPHISLIAAGHTFKQLVTNLVMDLVNGQDEEEIAVMKRSEASFEYLSEWYSNQYPSASRPPLILVVQDFENCSGKSLNDLITICSRYLSSLPIILIFGVATTLSNLQKTLPHTSTEKLTISTFGSPNAREHLEYILQSVVMDPQIPFKLSGSVLGYLVENFLFHDFSVKQFFSGYRFILGEHLHRKTTGLLMRSEEDAIKQIEKMSLEDLEEICSLKSFREYLEKQSIEVQAETLVNLEKCRQTVVDLLKDFFEYSRSFHVMVHIFYILTNDLPRRPMGTNMSDVYILCLDKVIHTTPEYREAFQFLKLSNRTDLQTKLDKIIKLAENLPLLETFGEKLRESQQKLRNLEMDGFESVADSPATFAGSVTNSGANSVVGSPAVKCLASKFGNSELNSPPPILPSSLDNSSISTLLEPLLESSSLATSLDSTRNNTPLMSRTQTPTDSAVNSPSIGRSGKLDRQKLHASLLEAVQKKIKPQMRPFDVIRSELMDVLHTNLKTFLKSPVNNPLWEIFFFSSRHVVMRHLAGAPRASLHTALTDPHCYLQHPHLKVEERGEIPSTFPDLCVAYKLHLECSRLINVYDWLNCWHSIVTGGEEQVAPEEQARFTRAVSELHHLGFVKTSSRKTDHVARLTFGGS